MVDSGVSYSHEQHDFVISNQPCYTLPATLVVLLFSLI